MKKIITKKLIIPAVSVFICLAIFSIFSTNPSSTPKAQAETSPDAIAIRVIKNADFLGIDRWYQNQGFKGSPQKLKVDGYDAIRDGRTVYVGASNVTGLCYNNGVNTGKNCNNNLDCLDSESCNLSSFYTNIYLISYNQSPEQATVDIFGQIISHWKFNANLNTPDKCSQSDKIKCLIDSECPNGEYCTSFKASVVRDVRRLADINEIKFALENYKQRKGYYPKLESGSYLPGSSLSVWPSWQETLAKELGLTLPSDPINTIGACSDKRFNPDTCWDDNKKEFDGIIKIDEIKTKLNQEKIYGYYNDNGHAFNLCSNLETVFSNTGTFKCDSAVIANRNPIITGVNLVGIPKEEFKGYVEAYDPDNDPISYSVELIPMSDGKSWTDAKYGWVWDNSSSNFTLKNTIVNNQRMIHAAKAGNASVPGLYKIKITVKDNQSGVAMLESDINIKAIDIKISSAELSIIIGHNKKPAATLTGTDSSGNPLTALTFVNAVLPDGSTVSTIPGGFSLSGMNLNIAYNATQKTGVYIINVYAEDSTTHKRGNSFFKILITNKPPEIKSFKATYINGQIQNCTLPANCEFTIDNGENASVQVVASDPDSGHVVKYSLADSFGGKLSINSAGKITGFKDLNYQGTIPKSYTIKVIANDDYCANSSDAECKTEKSFDMIVGKYCSTSTGLNTSSFHSSTDVVLLNGTATTNDFMTTIGFSPTKNCSSIANGRADIDISGVSEDMSIVFVIDTSGSMNGQYLLPVPPPGSEPIDLAKAALKAAVITVGNKASSTPADVTIKVGLVTYNSYVDNVNTVGLGDIENTMHYNNLMNKTNSLTANGGTNTFAALQKAAEILSDTSNNAKKNVVILLSDGKPEVWQNIKSCICAGGPWEPPVITKKEYDFQIAYSAQQCLPMFSCDSTSDCTNTCVAPKYKLCWNYNSPCDNSADVLGQANEMKTIYDMYTIYYNTGNSGGFTNPDRTMCTWSSEPTCSPMPVNPTFFYHSVSADIVLVFGKILKNVFMKPQNIIIDGVPVDYIDDPLQTTQTISPWLGISNYLSCTGKKALFANYNSSGSVKIKNISFDYCESLMH
jgi:hypothetical protein